MYYLNEITELEQLVNKVSTERSKLAKSTDLKVRSVFNDYFNIFQEFEIQVSGESAYFKLVDDADGSLRELFSVYFYSRYKEETRLELSYYTTSTQSEFELNRIIYLGQIARVIKDKSEIILEQIDQARKPSIERSNELYSIQSNYSKKIAEYQKANSDRKKVEIELTLRGGGVFFNKEVYIQLKRNYTIRVCSIKIVEVSKSGKTCVVVFQFAHGYVSREENCSTESIVSQVLCYSKDIVQELLPA